jgi:predicted metal-binding protein
MEDTWKLESDEERLASVVHAPKCGGCKGACISRASKRVGWEERLVRVVHMQSLMAARSECISCASKLVEA